MKYQNQNKQTPNVSKQLITPLGIILHHTAGSVSGSINWCMDAKSKVSYHCIVNENGHRTILARDNQRCWHAGSSLFKGRSDCNSFMLGIAVGLDTTKRVLTPDEVESVALWCFEKMQKYNFGIDWITTHREVSPGRKNDVDIRAEKDVKDRIKELINVKVNYEVGKGDTLFSISQRFGVSVVKIKSLNKLENDVLKIGQKLLIP